MTDYDISVYISSFGKICTIFVKKLQLTIVCTILHFTLIDNNVIKNTINGSPENSMNKSTILLVQ